MVKFFRSNGQAFISKKQKDLSGKSIWFVLKWYRKMSLPDNLDSQPISKLDFGLLLQIGVIFAVFHSHGNMQVDIDQLNIVFRDLVI